MTMKNHLILLSAGFPYGNQETFLENEVKILADNFDNITFVSLNPEPELMRDIPSNASVLDLKIQVGLKEKIQSFKHVMSRMFWKELGRVIFTYRKFPKPGIFATILVSLFRSEKIKDFLLNEIVNINPNDDRLVFYSYWCDDSALALARLKKHGDESKMITRAHGWDLYFEPSAFHFLPFRALIVEHLDFICPVSKFGASYIQQHWKIKDNSKIKVAYLGVNKAFKKSSINELGPFTIVSCSNCIPLKRIHLLIEALTSVQTALTWVHFGDGPLLDELKSQAVKHLPENIRFEFKGRMTNDDLLQWYADNTVDLFVHVSETEGLPVSMMEVTAHGIPLLACNVGGVSEIIEEGVNGYLLKSNPCIQEISNRIDEFLQMKPEARKEMGEASLQIWEKRYIGQENYRSFILNHLLKNI